MANPMAPPTVGEKWRCKPNRGSGTFHVTHIKGERITLRSVLNSKYKTISLRTLRGDYERSPHV
jgi:hypothetical protein